MQAKLDRLAAVRLTSLISPLDEGNRTMSDNKKVDCLVKRTVLFVLLEQRNAGDGAYESSCGAHRL
jgi:hypothetical protein